VRLTPRDTRFYDMFTEQARHLLLGAVTLSELVAAEPSGRAPHAERMRRAEHDADETTHAIMSTVNQTFVTPFDREDICALAAHLDDVMDAMEEAADLVVLYDCQELPHEFVETVKVLTQAAELTYEAMPRLRTMSRLSEYWIEINRLENEADRAHRKFLARLFGGDFDTLTVLKLRDVAEALEAAADAFETVANTVQTIAAKES
jgi:predicted phosphate transport protein (TIGR00153 family)